MNVSSVIIGLLDKLRNDTLKHFTVMDTYIYDETLDFRGRASQWLAREGIFQREEGETPKDWVFIIWNRGSLSPSNYNNKPSRVTVNTTPLAMDYADAETTMRMASLDIGIKVVTNNMSIAETIEEHLYVNTGEFEVFDADYGDPIGVIKCSAQPNTTTSFEKEDLASLGPVIGIGLSLNLNFPVIMPLEIGSVIKEIDYKLWQGIPPEGTGLIKSELIQ